LAEPHCITQDCITAPHSITASTGDSDITADEQLWVVTLMVESTNASSASFRLDATLPNGTSWVTHSTTDEGEGEGEVGRLVALRVILRVEGAGEVEPCGLFAYGEVEDYSARILPAIDANELGTELSMFAESEEEQQEISAFAALVAEEWTASPALAALFATEEAGMSLSLPACPLSLPALSCISL
jgi:hypothetical protein